MTRRIVMFVKKNGMRYITPEFNGDMEEFSTMHKLFGGGDSCDKTWVEMVRDIWSKATSYTEFVKANVYAQACYHSSLGGGEIEVVRNLPRNRKLPEDLDYILVLYEQDGGQEPLMKLIDVGENNEDTAPKGVHETPDDAETAPADETVTATGDMPVMVCTHTCPNCVMVKDVFAKEGVEFKAVYADDNPEYAQKLGIMQAPTLVVQKDGGTADLYSGVSSILGWLKSQK